MNFNNNNNSTTTPLGSSLLHVASTSLFHPSSSNKNNTISTNQIVNQNSNVYHSTMNPSLFSSSPSHAPPPPHHHHIISNTHGGMMNNTSTNSHHHHHHSINSSSSNNNNNNLATSTPNPTTPYGSQVGQSGFNFQSQTTSPFLHASSSTPIPTGPNNLFQFSSGSHALRSQPSNTMSFQSHSNHPTTTPRLLQESNSSQDDLFSVDKFFRHSTVDRTTTPIPTFQQQQISTNSAASRPTTMASSGGPPMNPSNHNNNFSPPLSSQWSHNYVASSTTSPRQPTNQTSDMMNHHGMIMDHQRRTMTSNSQLVNNSLLLPSQPHASQPSQQLSSHNLSVVNEEKSQIAATATSKKSKKKNNQTSSNLEIGQQPSQEIHEPTSTTMPNPSAKPKKQVAKESSTTSKTVSSVNNQGSIKVTRNISAERVENPTEPVEFPIDGVLYAYNVADWTDKNSFYDKIAYSFGTPSTQKKVHCAYLNCKVMHYERTCQGVYYCPHTDGDDSDHCIVRPCRLRFHTCQKHNNTTLTKSGKCPFKLHFYVPLEKDDNRRLLLCIGTHNHPLLCESDAAAMNSGITMGEKKSKINNVASSGSSTVMMPSTQDGSNTSQRKVAPKRTRKEKQPQTNSSNTAHASTTHQNYPQPTQNTPTQGMTMSQPSGYSSVSGNTSGQQPYYSSSTANLMEEHTSLNGSNTPTTNHASHHHPLNSSNVAAMSPPPSVKTLTRSTPPNMLSGSGGHHQGHHGSSNTYSGSSKIMSSSTPPLHDHTQQYNTSPTNPSSQLLGTCQKSTMNSFGGAMGGSASKIPPAASLTTTTTTLLQPSDYLQHVAKPPSYSLNNYNKDVDITRNPHNSVQSSPTSFMSASSPSLYRFSPNYPLPSSSTSSPHHHYSPHPPRINSSPLSLTSPSPLSGLYHPSPTSQFPPLPTQSSPSLFYEQNNAYGGVRNPSPHAIVYRGGNEDMDGVNARKRERLDGSFDAQKKVKTDFIDEPTPNINLPPIMYPSSDF